MYRVEPLPQSLIPLVWDFGKLDGKAEILYTRKIVARHVSEKIVLDISYPRYNQLYLQTCANH